MQRYVILAPRALGSDPYAFFTAILLTEAVLIHIKRETAFAEVANNVPLVPMGGVVVFSILVCHLAYVRRLM